VSVCAGAIVTESPVWTPIGSTFSIEQTITTLSLRSRITSSSNSPQPITDSSTRTWLIGLAASPSVTTWRSSVSVLPTPPPWPPRVKAGRTIAGRLIRPSASADSASARLFTVSDQGIRSPASFIVRLNSSRSSARRIAARSAPISSTPKRSSVPSSPRAIARLSAVWPPSVGSSASGRSFSMMCATGPGSSGST
jgi:hypothetical protein